VSLFDGLRPERTRGFERPAGRGAATGEQLEQRSSGRRLDDALPPNQAAHVPPYDVARTAPRRNSSPGRALTGLCKTLRGRPWISTAPAKHSTRQCSRSCGHVSIATALLARRSTRRQPPCDSLFQGHVWITLTCALARGKKTVAPPVTSLPWGSRGAQPCWATRHRRVPASAGRASTGARPTSGPDCSGRHPVSPWRYGSAASTLGARERGGRRRYERCIRCTDGKAVTSGDCGRGWLRPLRLYGGNDMLKCTAGRRGTARVEANLHLAGARRSWACGRTAHE
jgi:hypothetical protein